MFTSMNFLYIFATWINHVYWEEHASGSDRFEEDDDFYEWYEAEVNAYNVVFENMGKLFA